MNEYGEGLRNFIMRGRHLEGWIDFQSHQIFEEATIYTALQFFTKRPNDAVNVALAPTGEVPAEPFASNEARLPYSKLAFRDRWLLVTGADRDIIDKARKGSLDLDNPMITDNIFVGIQTSADDIYHLSRIGPGKYKCTPNTGRNHPPFEVDLEDEIMKPLVSGAEAKRYQSPRTDTFLLFPYQMNENRAQITTAANMAARFPKAWRYLRQWETELRERESSKMDSDHGWWGYNYPKNLDKQEIEKLIVPRLVSKLQVSVDQSAELYLDNVDVGGVAVAKSIDSFFVAGILNAPVAGFAFRCISKPFRGDFRSANKQFIAPLPVPKADKTKQADIAARANTLQCLHTHHRDLIEDIGRRISALPFRNRKLEWLFVELTPETDLRQDAPAHLDTQKQRDWAKRKYQEAVDARYDAISSRLLPGVDLAAKLQKGELKFLIDGVPIIDRVFVTEAEAPFILAQWTYLASTFSITAKTNGKKLCDALRKIAVTENKALIEQVISLQATLNETEEKIGKAESEMNAITYQLYGLSKEQIAHVELSLGIRR